MDRARALSSMDDDLSSIASSSSSTYQEVPKSLSFIIECFAEPLILFVNVKGLIPSLIKERLLSTDVAEKVVKQIKTESSKDVTLYLLNNILKKRTALETQDFENGTKFARALKNSNVPAHKKLYHYIQGTGNIPAFSDEDKCFRRALLDNLTNPQLRYALGEKELITALFRHFGDDEGERLLKQEDCRYIYLLFTLIRTPSSFKRELIQYLYYNHYGHLAKRLEDQCQRKESDAMDEDDVSSFYESWEEEVDDRMNMAGCPPETLNSLTEKFHFPEKNFSFMMDYSNIEVEEEYTCTFSPMEDGLMPTSEKLETQQFQGSSQLESRPSSLRPYQHELTKNAKLGHNTVILAPTNSGKTWVAGEIIKHHFSQDTYKPKVAFIVEKKLLADQQEAAIKKILGGGRVENSNIKVDKITGDTVVPDLDMMIDEIDVLVTTAGVLSSDHRAVSDQSILVSNFTLMIFDECHHCQKSHAYNRLMRMYRQEKKELLEMGKSAESLPQVIGLTATLGAGKGSRSTSNAVEHALTILANLNADSISTIVEERESLARYIDIPAEMSPVYVERRQVDPIADIITTLMTEIEFKMMELPGYNLIPSVSTVTPKDRKEYEQWVMTAKEKHCPEKVYTGEHRRQLMVCLEHLSVYYKALCINRDARSKDACKFLDDQFKTFLEDRANFIRLQWMFQESFTNQLKEMEKLSKNTKYRNPLLIELEPLLLHEFKANPESRALLFTDKIISTEYLKLWIEESPKLKRYLKPCRMTSETTEGQRKSIKEKFEAREFNIMVVTSVVEEGIDIGTCNLVYRLNYVPSDCGRIQQKGRIRAKNGKSFFVCYGNLQQNEMVAKMMEKLMQDAVKEINQMTEEALRTFLKKYERMDDRMTEEETRRRRLQEQGRDAKEYLLCCKRCGQVACSSYNIKRYNKSQHYVCSQSFCDDKIDIKRHPKPKKIDEMAKIGRVSCSDCGLEWGILAKLEESRFPVIKIDCFVVYELKEDESLGKAYVPKKWIKAPFTVEDVDYIDEDLSFDDVDFEDWG